MVAELNPPKENSDLEARRDACRQDVREGKWLATVDVAFVVFVKEVLNTEIVFWPIRAENFFLLAITLSLMAAFLIVFFQYWAERLISHYGHLADDEMTPIARRWYCIIVHGSAVHWIVGMSFLTSVGGLFIAVLSYLVSGG